MLLIFFSSLLFTLSFPETSMFPFSFLFLVPLLHKLKKNKNAITKSFLTGLLWTLFSAFGTAHFIFSALVIHYEKSIPTAVLFFLLAVVLPYGLLYGTFCAACSILDQKTPLLRILIPPSLWITIEYLSEALPFTIPWATIGHTLAPWNHYVQAADIIGPYGLSFLIVLTNSLIFHLTENITFSEITRNKLLTKLRSTVADNKSIIIALIVLFCLPPVRLNKDI